jgi:uncharacterized protein YfaS (alpha-2-macroglobulin family)
MKYYLLLVSLLLCVPVFSIAQVPEPYAPEWKKADSLLDKGLPQSAKKVAEAVYTKARQNGQAVQMLKAQLYLLRFDLYTGEDGYLSAITRAENEISSTSFPNNAVWQSIAAQLYWNYYQQNRWKIMNRTAVGSETVIAEVAQWDARRFYQKVGQLYRSSLSRPAALKAVAISLYDPVLQKGVNTRHLRPTLYDLLAFRALNFFNNDEKDVASPAFRFEITDTAAFARADVFMQHRFVTRDTVSLQWQALKIYQELLLLHKNDTTPDAFIDADLHRLEFVYRSSILQDKKERYIQALKQIEQRYPDNPLSALAAFRVAQAMMRTEFTSRDITTRSNRRQQTDGNLPEIKQQLDHIIQRFPKSEGGIMAAQLLASITTKELAVQTEQVVLPGEVSKAFVTYRNTSQAWFRIVPVDIEDYRRAFRSDDNKWKETLLKAKPLQAWSESLPGTSDLETHSTEVKIDALPLGMYAILVSADEKFSTKSNIINYAVFQSSRLSLITQYTGSGYVLDRKDGSAVSGATVELYKEEYRNREYELVVAQKIYTGKDGSFALKKNDRQYSAFSVAKGNDRLYLTEYMGFYDHGNEPASTVRTFFFTDRAIYRPGQTVYYKGIVVKREKGGRENNVVANEETEVTLYDVNGQKIGSQKLKTNEFGSITGSFIAPEGVLTGNMWLGNTTGTAYFSVEEYKRPKFAVSFDTLRHSYALEEKINITAKASAYAGNSINNATVSYRVVRRVRWPSWWSYYYWGGPSNDMEIANGITQTSGDGTFNISFTALADKSVNPQSQPLFSYTVYADVTDVNGETRSGSQVVNAGYTSITLSAMVPEKATPALLDTITVFSRNLNDAFVPASVRVQISRLQSPSQVLRNRLWATPDEYLMDSLTFKKHFPFDEYRDESDPVTWAKTITVFERSITTTKEGIVTIPATAWQQNGWYVVELETLDKSGKKITERKFVQVWDVNNKGEAPVALAVIPPLQKADPGQTAQVIIVSGYDSAKIIQQEQRMDNTITSTSLQYTSNFLNWSRKITEADRGGIALSWIMVKENRVYRAESFIGVLHTNKELDISWETHRDKVLPGAKETWTMVVRGEKKERVAAEMVAGMYDASLDAFRPHQWNMEGLFPTLDTRLYWSTPGFATSGSMHLAYNNNRSYTRYDKRYDELLLFSYGYFNHRYRRYEENMAVEEVVVAGMNVSRETNAYRGNVFAAPQAAMADGYAANRIAASPAEYKFSTDVAVAPPANPENEAPQNLSTRKDFRETAFFHPQLKTDAEGNVRIAFSMPEALTEWKLLGLAHTKDMRTGILEHKIKTQKDLMVMPGLPRFLRQGDKITLSTKVNNLTSTLLNGTAALQILNAETLEPLDHAFGLRKTTQPFTAAASASTPVLWEVQIPDTLYEPVIIRITASAGNFTDGEENILPVLTNRMMVTETLPLWINGNGEKRVSFDKLKDAGRSNTLSHHALSLEYTGNPAWYAVQALPYLMEYPYECAEQTFNRYYATALAAHIVQKNPKIEAIFKHWEKIDTASLLSNLEKNRELKSALLQETPWVLEAKNESEQKRRIAMLFETHKLSRSLDATMNKLEDMLLPEGGFPWFKGMYPDRYITQYIATGIARLQRLGVEDKRGRMQKILQRTLVYLDKKIAEDYNQLVKSKVKLQSQQIGYTQVQYLYLRSFLNTAVDKNSKTAFEYYQKQATTYWTKFNPYMKGMIALSLFRADDLKTSTDILGSLRETSVNNEETGMYWMQKGRSYWWYEAPVEAQSLLIEAFSEIDKKPADIDQMRLWLLKQKQTQNWESTKATADACYALLLSGSDWLANEPSVIITLGDKTIRSEAMHTQKGTGYFKVNYTGNDVKANMGDINLSVQHNNNSTSWGAVYWQYFEQMDKISFAATPLTVKKQLFIERNTEQGPELVAITPGNPLKIGDKVKARIEIIVDRDMEYVHLKDMRAAAFEPVNVISGYKWQGGLGYYEATRDASTNFFFNYLRKGKYVFEYGMFVTNKGDFSNGVATIQCMYAPEFSSHTAGSRVIVE